MNLTDYKFRCSSLGEIISKSGKTTQTMLSYLQRIYIEQSEGIRKDINSKYFEKGLFQEEDGISMLQNTLHKNSLVLKNKERKSNDFIHISCNTITNNTRCWSSIKLRTSCCSTNACSIQINICI